jgi:hypothetical protein
MEQKSLFFSQRFLLLTLFHTNAIRYFEIDYGFFHISIAEFFEIIKKMVELVALNIYKKV